MKLKIWLVIVSGWLPLFFGPTLVPREETYGEGVGCRKWLNGAWCVGGDRNVSRFPSDELAGGHLTLEMILFSDWIYSHSSSDLYLGGAFFHLGKSLESTVYVESVQILGLPEWCNDPESGALSDSTL